MYLFDLNTSSLGLVLVWVLFVVSQFQLALTTTLAQVIQVT